MFEAAALIALVVVAVLLVLTPPTWVRTARARSIRRRPDNQGLSRQWWPEPEVPVARGTPLLTPSTTTS